MAEAGRQPPTVAGLLARHAADPHRVFVASVAGPTVTYAEQLDRSRRVATVLAEHGVRAGDRVHVQLPNCLEFFDVWFAASLLGAMLLPTGPGSTVDELQHVFRDAQPTVSVVPPSPEQDTATVAGQRHVLATDELRCRAEQAGPLSTSAEDETAPAAILYTSGTTSRPKGVVVTEANYLAVGGAVARQLHVTNVDRWLVVLPLFHANAQYYCTMSALVTGASLALAPRFSAGGWGRQATESGATLASLFAAPVRMILSRAAEEPANRLRTVLFAQNLTDVQAAEFERRFGTKLVQLYGMTETVLPPAMNPDDGSGRWDSVGRPLPEVAVRVVDEDGFDVQPGTPGELWVGGEPGRTVAAGYWNNNEATSETFGGGWLRTGDLVRADDAGLLYFVDRSKDMIKRSGENVSAGEIERVAGEHPGVSECAAVGVPDPVRDQSILLVAVRRPGHSVDASDLLAWCAARLASYKVPGNVTFVDALPRTSVGKIRKTGLTSLVTPQPDRGPQGSGHHSGGEV